MVVNKKRKKRLKMIETDIFVIYILFKYDQPIL